MNATSQQESTALTVIERASVALGSSKKAEELTALALQSRSITAITNTAGYDECHSARMALKNERVSIAKLGKDARDDATKFSKAVIEEEKRLIGIIQPEETRLQAIQDAHDAKMEAEKAAKAQAEANRIAEIQRKIAAIVAFPSTLQGSTAAEIEMAMKVFISQPAVENWAMEFSTIASSYFEAAVNTLSLMRAGAEAQEKAKAEEEARIQAEREELARLRAEQEERNRQEAAQHAEAEKVAATQRAAEAEKLAAERAEFERQRQAQIEADRATQAARDAEDARVRAEQQAEAKRLQDQRDELARQQDAIEAQRKAAELATAATNMGAAAGGSQPVDASTEPRSVPSQDAQGGQISAERVSPMPITAPAVWQAALDNLIAKCAGLTVSQINILSDEIDSRGWGDSRRAA